MKNLFLPEIDYNASPEFNMKMFSGWNLRDDSSVEHRTIDNCFTPQECLQIIKLGRTYNIDQSKTGDGNAFSEVRKSRNSWLMPSELTNWIYLRIQEKIEYINNFFGFDLTFIENLQFTEYDSNYSGHYGKHLDKFDMPTNPGVHRKLSFSIQLTEPCKYEGGDLLIFTGEKPLFGNKNLGCINFFPSYALHEVTPVTKGKRYALVSWVNGPKFK